MLKALVRKQMMEIYRMYFFDNKKKKARAKGKIIASFVLFGLLIFGILGGLSTALSIAICVPFSAIGLNWLFFTVLGTISILLGVFGGVFNTYSGLYLSKDNDFLLSMPIPVRTIIASRLISVYLIGLMYSGLISIPAVIVNLCVNGFSVSALIRGALFVFSISLFVLILSCILGWVVAKISLKLKRKGVLAAFFSLIFFALYYSFFLNFETILNSFIVNAVIYGASVQNRLHVLYLLGNIPLKWNIALIACAVTLVLFFTVAVILEKSFLGIATNTGNVRKTAYIEKRIRVRSVQMAMLRKEFKRLFCDATYMLNSAIGTLFLPTAAIALLLKADAISESIGSILDEAPEFLPILLCAVVCLLACMNYTATPSVSLEGKNLWIARSLPIPTWEILRAKLCVQLLLTLPGVLLLGLCMAFVFTENVESGLAVVLFPLIFSFLNAEIDLFLGIKGANLEWTNETVPIKQSFSVFLALFGSWMIVIAFGGLWFLIGKNMRATTYISIMALIALFASVLLHRWLRKNGTALFEKLNA